ncbi:MAG: hypothetical protein NZ526_04645, partial [Aquificaceae bacterium]|nr:hypothetical protein [Aquificaceae bacterium]
LRFSLSALSVLRGLLFGLLWVGFVWGEMGIRLIYTVKPRVVFEFDVFDKKEEKLIYRSQQQESAV